MMMIIDTSDKQVVFEESIHTLIDSEYKVHHRDNFVIGVQKRRRLEQDEKQLRF